LHAAGSASIGGLVVVLGLTVSAHAAEKTLLNKGGVLVKENCSRCHATGKERDSPHKETPPFRIFSSLEDLSESLAERIVSGHPDMPIFVFSPHDIEAIIEYLQSIQVK